MNVDFREWLYDSVQRNLTNKQKATSFKDEVYSGQLQSIGNEKNPIKKKV